LGEGVVGCKKTKGKKKKKIKNLCQKKKKKNFQPSGWMWQGQ